MAKRVCSYSQLKDSVKSVYFFFFPHSYQTLVGLLKIEQKREVEDVIGHNAGTAAGAALIWALTSKRPLKFNLHFSSVKANKHRRHASLCSWANLQNKETAPGAKPALGTKKGVKVRAAASGVQKGSLRPVLPVPAGLRRVSSTSGPRGLLLQHLRQGLLARDLKYFEFRFWKLALNLTPFKLSFTCWERKLFKL